jgi:hypothetical protein
LSVAAPAPPQAYAIDTAAKEIDALLIFSVAAERDAEIEKARQCAG